MSAVDPKLPFASVSLGEANHEATLDTPARETAKVEPEAPAAAWQIN
jgi:hypothetical protein